MHNRLAIAMLLLVFVLAACNQSGAQDENMAIAFGGRPLSTTLSGNNEVPPRLTGGSGSASITLNHGLGEVCFEIEATLTKPATASHIHKAVAGVNGPIVVNFGISGTGPWNGCVSNVDRVLIKDIIQNPEGYYINVHNADFPPGAVRGQLSK